MKKMFVLFVLFLAVVPLFAATLVRVDEVDDFGDPTGKSHLTFDQDLSGTFKNSSTNGSLQWNIVIDPKNGTAYFVLKENGKDVDVTTSSWSPYYLDDSIYYTISLKSSDNQVRTLYGKLCKTDSYKTNGLTIYGGLYLWGYLYDYALYNCIDLFGTGDSFKVSIKSDYGSYSLGALDMSEFPALVFDDSLYNDGVQLMEAGKYKEALDVFEEYKTNDALSYAHFKTYEQVEKCKDELEKTGVYFVGRLGPSGGYVFYDKGVYSDGWRYLEAAPADLKVVNGMPTVDASASGYDNAGKKYIFGYYRDNETGKYELVGTDTSIGSGKANTEKLVNAMGDNAYGYYRDEVEMNYAARLCSILKYEHDGVVYDDWFLPSKDELNLMYENLRKKGLGSFADDYYWSSSEANADYAWAQYFGSGYQSGSNRSTDGYVRPIRAF